MRTDAERRAEEKETLLREALRKMFPKQDIVKKGNELWLIIREQFKAKPLPTNMNSIEELHEAQEERWYSWIASADHADAEIWIGMEVHFEQCRKEIAAAGVIDAE